MVRIYRSRANVRLAARLAVEHHLFIDDWSLIRRFRQILDDDFADGQFEIGLHFVDSKPVAVALKLNFRKEIWVFCAKEHRRNGYTSRIVKRLGTTGFEGRYGLAGSRNFWRSIDPSIIVS